MGNITTSAKALITISVLTTIYIIVVIVYAVGIQANTAIPTIPPIPTFVPTPPIPTFTPTPTPTTEPVLTTLPTVGPTTPAPTQLPHLDLVTTSAPGPENAPPSFYRQGCQTALTSGLFPFTSFNTAGTYYNGAIQNYYKYDTWGYGGNNGQYDCGHTLLGGKNTCPSSAATSPNRPWTDEQCDICATAAQDPNCEWYGASCAYPNNATTYHGMDISNCYYNPQLSNSYVLCCNSSVA